MRGLRELGRIIIYVFLVFSLKGGGGGKFSEGKEVGKKKFIFIENTVD